MSEEDDNSTVDAGSVTLELTQEECLVLYDCIARFQETGRLEFAHPAEKVALWNLYLVLERVLDEPRWSNYEAQRDAARIAVWNLETSAEERE